MKQALLIIDVQKDYFKNGKMELAHPEKALVEINKLEDKFLKLKLPIIYIQHINHKVNATFFTPNTLGVELHERLRISSDSIIIEKHFPNSFKETTLLDVLQMLKIEQVVITGMMTHMCIDSTTRAASELGYKPILISDATSTKNLMYLEGEVPAKQVQLSYLSGLQNFAFLETSREFLARL